MKTKYAFESSEFEGTDYSGDGVVAMTTLETSGDSLHEMLNDASVGLMDWHGNDRGHVGIGELDAEDYKHAVYLIAEYYAEANARDEGLRAITKAVGG